MKFRCVKSTCDDCPDYDLDDDRIFYLYDSEGDEIDQVVHSCIDLAWEYFNDNFFGDYTIKCQGEEWNVHFD